jgi:ribosomal protein S12 methylthiotransferase
VVREVEHLAARGVVEVNLISQDTIAYGRDHSRVPREKRTSLAELVRRVADVHGIRWVRIFYLYPEKIDEALIDLLKGHPRVVPYVDMPLQHASSGMLARMRRGHGEGHQKRVVDELRTQIPNLVFRTAFIVGHPGETDDDFRQLVDFVIWARFDHVGVFRYSDEDSSASAAQEGKVPEKVMARRWRQLMAAQRKIAREKNKARIGQELDVLVEGPSEEHELVMVGRHSGQAPEIDGQVYLSGAEVTSGQMRRVRIAQASDYDLVGDVIDGHATHATEAAGRATGDRAAVAKKKIRLKVISNANTD